VSSRMLNHVCQKCGIAFQSSRSRQSFCSTDCRGKPNRSTADQYSKIDGDLSYYLNRLLYKDNHRAGKSRENITREQLMELWNKQKGLCAISAIPMTYRAVKGEWFPYNASIDCIKPRSKGGRYEIENIQLVISFINPLVKEHPKELFIDVCFAVADKFRERRSVKPS
jgi:hypothetical protein